PATARASFAMYNTKAEVDALVSALNKIVSAETRLRKQLPESSLAPSPGASPTEIIYPSASASSIVEAADTIAADFEVFEDRESKTEYVTDLGRKLPHNFDLLKSTGLPRIPGCMSEVYLFARKVDGSSDRIEFIADADPSGNIVRGLIVVLERLFS